jgi:hypothetical protein
MLLEELTDHLSFVAGEIVEDDVNLLPRRAQADDLLQKGNELTAGVAGSGFAVDATGGGIEGCISGDGAVAVVLEAVAFGASRRERQDGIKTTQGLNGGLLIDAKHGCGLGRVQIEAEDVGGFGFELGAAVSPSRWNMRPPVGCFCIARRLMTTCMSTRKRAWQRMPLPRSPSAKSLWLGAIPAARLAQGNGRGSPAATEVWFGIAIAPVLTDRPFWDRQSPFPRFLRPPRKAPDSGKIGTLGVIAILVREGK